MRERFSVPQIAKRQQPAQANFLPPEPGHVPGMQKARAATADIYPCLRLPNWEIGATGPVAQQSYNSRCCL
ncbi:MAG: hypothetical protein ACI9UA_005759 [Pseudoalteromonas tetraodonis]|jgi:hypothetical protein